MNDDPRTERTFVVTVLAYPGMADGDIIDEIEALTSDPAQAFQVLSIVKNPAEDTELRDAVLRKAAVAIRDGADYDETVRILQNAMGYTDSFRG